MRKITEWIIIASAAIVLSGCATGKWERIPYETPGSTLNLKEGAKVKIAAFDQKNQPLVELVGSLENAFRNSGKVMIDDKDPDYIFVLNLQRDYRHDTKDQLKFNTKYYVKKVENKSSGRDEIASKEQQTSTNATFVSIVLYKAKTLTPEYSFDLLVYDSEIIPQDSSGRDELQYNKKFTSQITAKLKAAFLSQYRKIYTYLPKNADDLLLESLTSLTKANIALFHKRKAEILSTDFDKFLSDAQAGKYKEKQDEMEALLSNYYMVAVFQEVFDFNPKNLKALFARQLKILELTQNEALVLACSNSLGRIESKWRTIENTDIGGND